MPTSPATLQWAQVSFIANRPPRQRIFRDTPKRVACAALAVGPRSCGHQPMRCRAAAIDFVAPYGNVAPAVEADDDAVTLSAASENHADMPSDTAATQRSMESMRAVSA